MNDFKQKAAATALAGCLIASVINCQTFAAETNEIVPQPEKNKAFPFVDVEGHWGKSAIEFVVDKEIFHGTSDTTFEPNGTLNREQMAVVLYNFAKVGGLNIVPSGNNTINEFADAGDRHEWGKEGMSYCVDNGIMLGSDGRLEPNGIVTRGQLAKMIFAFAKNAGYDVSLSDKPIKAFEDVADIPEWANDGMKYCLERGILQGDDENYISSLASASRAEMAAVMQKFAGVAGIK